LRHVASRRIGARNVKYGFFELLKWVHGPTKPTTETHLTVFFFSARVAERDPDLKVEMNRAGATRVPHVSDDLARCDDMAWLHAGVRVLHVCVEIEPAFHVRDDDEVPRSRRGVHTTPRKATTSTASGHSATAQHVFIDDRTESRRVDGRAQMTSDVDAAVYPVAANVVESVMEAHAVLTCLDGKVE
jgi:hypothetical protein